jgi:hypothetical protein
MLAEMAQRWLQPAAASFLGWQLAAGLLAPLVVCGGPALLEDALRQRMAWHVQHVAGGLGTCILCCST